MGPLELRPVEGECWAFKGSRDRLPATYTRPHGTQQFLDFLDIHADCPNGQVRCRKTSPDILATMRRLRACYPKRLRLYVIMDNLSAHKHRDIAAFMRSNNMEPAWTPTYASWLNPIEKEFKWVRKFVFRNEFHRTKAEQRKAIRKYLTWRNHQKKSFRCPLGRYSYISLELH